ncbi:nicotinamide phosphoribosyltransferase [Listeria phage LP-083-2]|uniref:Nicotinamide phosphoribosyltransferase n=3 Tax=Pecentumvirus TaxID=1857844 RepID=A0A059T6V3_9CAUD|nr:nicotinamide phosphoribosyl transferase [Listeria phage LP-083-2]YP_009784580.1 nicotinamide phosphoribosyltransferase [Listeria phage LP-124]AHL19354.1 nicotinamide phosphoribosyltransferase [Listeria phage LP-083-2]AHL19465.1 nicotinamide phosphoribosyltransferase [Listeria phage LP-124]QDK04979.2 nicotinamide phosphoribosyltransferase [Listeria phage LP-066]
MRKLNEISMLMSDCYKFGHMSLYPKGITQVYSTLVPRDNTYFFGGRTDKMVVFGYQMFVQRFLLEHFNKNFFELPIETVKEDYHYVVSNALGEKNARTEHIEALHKLGYLPIKVRALPEGTLVPMRVPVLTIENTHPDFAWLTNFLETVLLSQTFLPATVATTALEAKKIMTKYGEETCDNLDHIMFQGHDFSERGQHSNEASLLAGMGHLVNFAGSDTIQASVMAHNYYSADLEKELVLKSVTASEHSVMQSYGTDEVETFSTLIDNNPDGILSLVSDTYDYYGVLTEVLPKLKDKIMNRNGKLVIRPDSGNPVDIIAGRDYIEFGTNWFNYHITKENLVKAVTSRYEQSCSNKPLIGQRVDIVDYLNLFVDSDYIYNNDIVDREKKLVSGYYKVTLSAVFLGEDLCNQYKVDKLELEDYQPTPEDKGSLQLLWETFGGSVNEKGHKVLDEHIGLLYGEGIDLEMLEKIFTRMSEKGFASSNVVFGLGAYMYSFSLSRDSFAQAIKSQMVVINGEEKLIFKNPKTDTNHIKKSLKGRVCVTKKEGTYEVTDALTAKEEAKLENLNELNVIFEDGKLAHQDSFHTIRERLDREAKKY